MPPARFFALIITGVLGAAAGEAIFSVFFAGSSGVPEAESWEPVLLSTKGTSIRPSPPHPLPALRSCRRTVCDRSTGPSPCAASLTNPTASATPSNATERTADSETTCRQAAATVSR